MNEIDINLLFPSKLNPRDLERCNADDLVPSIRANGIIEPLVVCPNRGKYEILCGARRHIAAKEVGLETVPVVVREGLDPKDKAKIAIAEQIAHSDLTEIEEARGLSFLRRYAAPDEIALDLGIELDTVSERLGVLELPQEAINDIDAGALSYAAAVQLRRLSDPGAFYDKHGARDGGTMLRLVEEEIYNETMQARREAQLAILKAEGVDVITSDEGVAELTEFDSGWVPLDAPLQAQELHEEAWDIAEGRPWRSLLGATTVPRLAIQQQTGYIDMAEREVMVAAIEQRQADARAAYVLDHADLPRDEARAKAHIAHPKIFRKRPTTDNLVNLRRRKAERTARAQQLKALFPAALDVANEADIIKIASAIVGKIHPEDDFAALDVAGIERPQIQQDFRNWRDWERLPKETRDEIDMDLQEFDAWDAIGKSDHPLAVVLLLMVRRSEGMRALIEAEADRPA